MTWTFQRPKYRAVPTVLDGFRFSSRMEAAYYSELLLYKKAGAIVHIDVHPCLTLGHGDRVTLDFLVWHGSGRVEGVDVKGATKTRAASEFRRLRKRWNHPTVSLSAVTLRKGRWEEWK